jgi:cation-transporting ATPase 13A1
MIGEHRSSCIFAGTKLLYSSNEDSELLNSLPPLPTHLHTKSVQPTIYLTLRTGSYSSRGEIVQAMMTSKMNMGLSNESNEKDSMRLIGALSSFAVTSCIFLLLNEGKQTSVFKRIVQCIRIIVASIPSDLSSSLAASEHACSTILREEFDVVGTEPGALVSTAKTDAVVFDKTGTLTADTQSLTSIVYPPSGLRTLKNIKFLSKAVLAGAHTLIQQSDSDDANLVGDPVDLAALQWTQWKYNAKDKSASSGRRGEKLWQRRSFPFDSTKKTSSAIVLTKDGNGHFRLRILVKGSPNTMKKLLKDNETSDLAHWYDRSVKRLGSLGYRSICLGALDVSNTDVAKTLFPSGLPNSNTNNLELESILHNARMNARVFHRNDIEQQHLDFVGFACFNAPMRESTPRIVQELKVANIDVIMLTGDEPYASLACAAKAGIVNSLTPSKTHFLRRTSFGSLVWESDGKTYSFSLEAAKLAERDICDGGTLIASGDAVSTLLQSDGEVVSHYVKDRILPHVRVVASASPKDKYTFVTWLKRKKHVLMCGDGVNDIAAMTKADTSAAMLSGFSSNSEGSSKDFEDSRRKERLKKRRIGSNRLKSTSASVREAAGIGNSSAAVQARIQRRILEGVPVVDAIQEEFKRRNEIKKGGSTAARIMEREARLSKSMQEKALSVQRNDEEDSCIQTGEACLASSFTLLRPCISGIDSILRAGIAAASSGISTYRKVALSCILSSYNLATLYRNGLRYGKWMWQAELFGMIYTDRAAFMASSTPRPRLIANVRPSETFNFGEVLSTLGQASVHIATLTLAVNSAKQLQERYPSDERHTGFGIRWSSTVSENAASVGAVLASLTGSATSTSLSSSEEKQPQSFFRRNPFRPNYVSNAVFIVSIFQNAVITMVNHGGRPFSVSFLESRPLCLSGMLMYLPNVATFFRYLS